MAQVVDFKWAKSFGGVKSEIAVSVLDRGGNVYTAGYFEGTVDFDPSSSTYNLTSNGQTDAFVQKLDSAGNLVWAVSYGGTDWDRGTQITLDSSGNLFVCGYFYGSGDFDPGSKTQTLKSNGKSDIFVQRFDTAGNLIWAISFGGSDDESVTGVSADTLGGILLTGWFGDKVDFDPSSSVSTRTSNGNSDVFIQRLSTQGKLIWVKSLGGSGEDYGLSIVSDKSGNLYITGVFWGTVDFNPSTTKTDNLTSNGLADAFLLRMDSKGDYQWATSFGNSAYDRPYQVDIDQSNNAYLVGIFSNTVDFDPGTKKLELSSNGMTDVFISKFYANGTFAWAKSFGGANTDYGYDITVDRRNYVYVTGGFTGTVDLDPGKPVQKATSSGGDDVYIQKFTSSGGLEWFRTLGGSSDDVGRGILRGNDDFVTVCGTFVGKVDFDPGKGTTYLSSNGAYDVFVLKLDECRTYDVNDVVTACDSFTWINGITYMASNHFATHTLQTAQGCDSVIHLKLTINPAGVDTVVSCDSFTWRNGVVYTSSTNGATDTLQSSLGCDSIVHLYLTILQSDTSVDTVSACDSFTWINGKTYLSTTKGVKHQLVNSKGCDSIVTLDLTIGHPNTSVDKIHACGPYTWIDGKTYYSSTYEEEFLVTNASGCDSLITLDLTVGATTWSDDTVFACDSFTWINGVTYTSSISTEKDTLINTSHCDSIVRLVLTLGRSSETEDVISSCQPYQWIDGVTYTESNNAAEHRLVSSLGCDSIIKLNLKMEKINVGISPKDQSLEAEQENAGYQWLDCASNFARITGATEQNFLPETSGIYAVEITRQSCIDTSACINFTHAGINAIQRAPVRVYPNPSSGRWTVDLSKVNDEPIILEVLDLSGKVVYSKLEVTTKEEINLQTESGLYFLRVEFRNSIYQLRLLSI